MIIWVLNPYFSVGGFTMLLMTNVDNINCDHVPYVIEELMKKGARNVHVLPSITKKGRNEYIFFIDCIKEQVEDLAEFLVIETGTLGVRIIENEHYAFEHEIKKLQVSFKKGNDILWYGSINFKIVRNKSGENLSVRAEYEEVKALTKHLRGMGLNTSLHEVKEMVERCAVKKFKDIELKYEDPSENPGEKKGLPVINFSIGESLYM
jgi:uncharacterized protein (DUF111 family)